jgi:RHS repeat-associated protein
VPLAASYQYDTSNRITASTLTGQLTGSPQGTYTYDATHYHAVDAIGSSAYEAQYDAAGNMTCRTPSGPQVCTSGSQTGAKLTYDAEERLIQWVSADGATTVKYGYDGEGQRFEMQVITSSATTTTTYIGNLEEVQTVGSSTTKIVYFYLGSQRVAEDDNTVWYYPINDQLTSTTVVVNFAGVVAAQLFGPYGQTRWAGGTMPTTFAFTGQRADATTGLDYYGARYYDPAAGTFTSADTVLPGGGSSPAGLNRYAYVAGNPETLTDPTGHARCRFDAEDCGGKIYSPPVGVSGDAGPLGNCRHNPDLCKVGPPGKSSSGSGNSGTEQNPCSSGYNVCSAPDSAPGFLLGIFGLSSKIYVVGIQGLLDFANNILGYIYKHLDQALQAFEQVFYNQILGKVTLGTTALGGILGLLLGGIAGLFIGGGLGLSAGQVTAQQLANIAENHAKENLQNFITYYQDFVRGLAQVAKNDPDANTRVYTFQETDDSDQFGFPVVSLECCSG